MDLGAPSLLPTGPKDKRIDSLQHEFLFSHFVHIGKRLEKESFALDIDQALDLPPLDSEFEFILKDPKTLIVTVKKGQKLNQVFESLSDKGITVLSMRNETGRLE